MTTVSHRIMLIDELVDTDSPTTDKQAIETLLDLAETYGGHGKDLSTQGVGAVQGAHTDNSLQVMEANLKVCCSDSKGKPGHADPIQDAH